MIQSKQSIIRACASYYDLSPSEIFAEENSKSVCICLSLKYCRYPLGTEGEQEEAVLVVNENPELKRAFDAIEQILV